MKIRIYFSHFNRWFRKKTTFPRLSSIIKKILHSEKYKTKKNKYTIHIHLSLSLSLYLKISKQIFSNLDRECLTPSITGPIWWNFLPRSSGSWSPCKFMTLLENICCVIRMPNICKRIGLSTWNPVAVLPWTMYVFFQYFAGDVR